MGAHDEKHWNAVYETKGADKVSWFRPHLDRSLSFIEGLRLEAAAPIIDVGGGASTLVDDLLDRGFTDVTVLDLSASALEVAKQRLGARASQVKWLHADITSVALPASHYAFWNDRAVFHFLETREDRARYVAAARQAIRPGGHIVVGTFGPDGPEKCSGLPVQRYSPDALHEEFGAAFEKVSGLLEAHTTPAGNPQQFSWCLCRVSGT